MSDGNATINEIKPSEARDYKGDLYVQNLTPQTIMYSGPEGLTLGPKGSTSGVAFLPQSVALNPGFQRVWRRGSVRVVDQETYDTLVDEIDEMERLERERHAEKVRSVIEPPSASKDMYPVRNSYGEVTFESKAEKDASGRTGLANDENLVSVGQVPISTGFDESTGKETVQTIPVTVTETQKESN